MEQLTFDGKSKTDLSVEFIQKHEPLEGYFVGFSGGKDSQVVYDLVKKSGVKYQVYYSATGIDPPELVKFIRQYYPEVIWKRPNWHGHKSFFGMIPEKGFPTKMARWCCDKLKKDPTKKVPLSHRIMGIRAEESHKRAVRGQVDGIKYLKQTIYKPIFHWLEWEIWDYLKSNNIKYCSLYNEGFHRLGCVVCPFICSPNRKALDKHKARWPKYYVAFEKAMLKLWNNKEKMRRTKLGLCIDFDEFLDRWYRGY